MQQVRLLPAGECRDRIPEVPNKWFQAGIGPREDEPQSSKREGASRERVADLVPDWCEADVVVRVDIVPQRCRSIESPWAQNRAQTGAGHARESNHDRVV